MNSKTASLPNPDTVDWSAPFKDGENIRVLTPIQSANMPKAERRHLASLPREYRARLEAEWQAGEDAVAPVRFVPTPEIKARADAQWIALSAEGGE